MARCLYETGHQAFAPFVVGPLLGRGCRLVARLIRGTRTDTFCGGLLGATLGATILLMAMLDHPSRGEDLIVFVLAFPILGAFIGALGSRQAAR